jgi:hypothetical protein
MARLHGIVHDAGRMWTARGAGQVFRGTSMIPKSGNRFSDKIMLKQKTEKAGHRPGL